MKVKSIVCKDFMAYGTGCETKLELGGSCFDTVSMEPSIIKELVLSKDNRFVDIILETGNVIRTYELCSIRFEKDK
jgi:hypothetical protein